MTHNVTEIQQRLIDLGYLAAGQADGKFGAVTLDAYNRFRASKGEPPHTGLLLLVEVSADVFPEDAPPPAPPSIFDQIGTLLSLIAFLKGKTMTADQITGVIRAIIAAVSGALIAKGWGDADFWTWVGASVTAIVPVIWTIISNRPKTIVPIAAK